MPQVYRGGMKHRGAYAPDPQELAGLRTLVDTVGLEEVQRRTRLGRVTLTKALASLPVSTGTLAAIREAVRA